MRQLGKAKESSKRYATHFGILIIAVGVVLVLIGILAYFGGLGWFGNLPGDINIERGNTRIYIPRIG